MKREEKQRARAAVISAMAATAKANGKPADYLKMYDTARRLHRIEATLERLAEDECCSYTYDEAKQTRLENLAQKIIRDEIGCNCYTQRDPRGYAIRMYLIDEDGRRFSNSWDGETAALAW